MVWQVDPEDYNTSWPLMALVVIVLVMCSVFSCSCFAWAEGEEVKEDSTQNIEVSVDNSGVVGAIVDLQVSVDRLLTIIEGQERDRILDRENLAREKDEQRENKADSPELTELKSINKNLGILIEQNTGEKYTEEKSVGMSKAATAFVAYGNVSPTNQYAQYAIGLLPTLGWEEHYVFLQDSNQAYTFVWGDLSASGNHTISGSSCSWLRWYWAGQSTGYVLERGAGSVTVSPSQYTLLADIDGWPTLGDGSEVLRREVMLYAVVAVCVFSLASVLRFCVRRGGTA